MGTSATVGFTSGGVSKIVYVHSDGGPDQHIGKGVLDYLRNKPVEELKQVFDSLRVIDTAIPPTEEDKQTWAPYTDLNVGDHSLGDWYCLTRGAQGRLDVYETLGAIPAIDDDDIEIEDYSYIIDLDAGCLIVSSRGNIYPTYKHLPIT